MKILVMHQVPYRKIQYHLGIDHDRHEVAYYGTGASLAAVPEGLRCARVELEPDEDLADQIIAKTSPQDGFEHVLALSEFGILEAARVRAHLGLPGPPLASLERIRDKVAMKQALAAAGVPHPRFAAEPGDVLPWSGKTVVKPRRGASSEGVTVHATAGEAVARYRALADPADYELEEFVEGDLFHADGLVCQGTMTDAVVSRYVGRPVGFANGEPVGSGQLPPDERHRAFLVRALAAVGVEEGCFHLEFFETPDGELVFLEVANRLGGAGIVDEFLRHTGVHLPSHEIAIRLGFQRPVPQPASGRYHGFLLFPGHHFSPEGGWRAVIPDAVHEHPCLDRIHTSGTSARTGLKSGQITYQEWQVPVFIEASHPDPDALAEFLEECYRTVEVVEDDDALAGGILL